MQKKECLKEEIKWQPDPGASFMKLSIGYSDKTCLGSLKLDDINNERC